MLDEYFRLITQFTFISNTDIWLFIVYIALGVSTLFWLLCIIGITILYYQDNTFKKTYESIYASLWEFVYKYVLNTDTTENYPIQELGFKLHKATAQKAVRQILNEFIFAIGGKKGDRLRNLFHEMGFDSQALRTLHRADKHVSASVRALSDLTLMRIIIDNKSINQLLASRKREIRVATYIYLLQVKGEEAYDCVFERLYDITPLDAIDIYQAITLTEYTESYPFYKHLNTAKSDIVIGLIMDLMVYYHNIHEESIWTYIESSKNVPTICKAINTLGKLMAIESDDKLKRIYYKQEDEKVKLEIVKAIGRIGHTHSLNFLVTIFKNEKSPALRKHAYRSLLAQRPISQPTLDKLFEEANNDDKKLFLYVGHPMVFYI